MPLSIIMIGELHVTRYTRLPPNKPRQPQYQGEPRQPNQTPGKLISVTVIIHFCNEEI